MCHDSYECYDVTVWVGEPYRAGLIATHWRPSPALREEMRTQPQGEDSEAGDDGLRARGENIT